MNVCCSTYVIMLCMHVCVHAAYMHLIVTSSSVVCSNNSGIGNRSSSSMLTDLRAATPALPVPVPPTATTPSSGEEDVSTRPDRSYVSAGHRQQHVSINTHTHGHTQKERESDIDRKREREIDTHKHHHIKNIKLSRRQYQGARWNAFRASILELVLGYIELFYPTSKGTCI